MKDLLASLIFIPSGLPLGAALALFILWNDKRRCPPRRRSAANIPGGIALIGIGLNLPFAALTATHHEWREMKEHLFIAIVWVLAAFGALLVTRRAQIEPPDRPNFGGGI